jgi:circadian clock protein KaiB
MTGTSKTKRGRARSRKKHGSETTAEFERLLRTAAQQQQYVLRLYITGSSPRSCQAIANIRSLCEELLPGRYELGVIDIYQQPAEAAGQQIIAAPTLVKELPMPPKRMIGDLSSRDRVIVGLDLDPAKTAWIEV